MSKKLNYYYFVMKVYSDDKILLEKKKLFVITKTKLCGKQICYEKKIIITKKSNFDKTEKQKL